MKTTRLIGQRWKRGNAWRLLILIGRGLDLEYGYLRERKVKLEMRVESGTEAKKELFQGHSFDCAVFRV